MPNRWIRESARTSKNLGAVSDFAERLFWRLITTADDYGRFLACPSLVRAACFPLVDRLSIEKVDKALAELSRAGLIELYQVGDRRYGHFLKWLEHQGPPRSHKSKYPDPPTVRPESIQVVAPVSANICLHLQTNANPSQHICSAPDTDTDPDTLSSSSSFLNSPDPDLRINDHATPDLLNGFNDFWAAYPKKRSKGRAEGLWGKLKPSQVLQAQILEALDQAKTSVEWMNENGQYIPYPAKWLADKGWEDVPMTVEPKTSVNSIYNDVVEY